MSDEPQDAPPEDAASKEAGRKRDFRKVVPLYASVAILTHVAATVAVLSLTDDLEPLAVGLLVGSTITIAVLISVGVFAFRRIQ